MLFQKIHLSLVTIQLSRMKLGESFVASLQPEKVTPNYYLQMKNNYQNEYSLAEQLLDLQLKDFLMNFAFER